jgi:hypothetical protein
MMELHNQTEKIQINNKQMKTVTLTNSGNRYYVFQQTETDFKSNITIRSQLHTKPIIDRHEFTGIYKLACPDCREA